MNLRQQLEKEGVDFELISKPDTVHTADASAVSGIRLEEITKSLVCLDPFTLAALSNVEMIDVNQDPLGIQGRRYTQDGEREVWARPLWDGTMAVGLFNRGSEAATVSVQWSDLGLSGVQRVRDIWQQKDVGDCSGEFSVIVPRHGAVFLKVGTPNRTDW